MNHIIDGHNLIAKIAGLSLDMPDDEQRLVELLVIYCKAGGDRVEVFFDGAPVGQAGVRNFSRVRAHFVPQSQTADDAILNRIASLGRAARNWMVVSSDRSVQAAAHSAHACVLSSEEFSSRMQAPRQAAAKESSSNQPLNEAEVRLWLDIFKERPKP
jgi:predicted RNA-binding protein with PIN domain